METFAMLTTISVALITAVFGPIAVAWAKSQFGTPPPPNQITESLIFNSAKDLANNEHGIFWKVCWLC